MKILVLCLEGPLQSWGVRGKWEMRDTADLPTKSAVIGLLGCAMGIPRNNPKLLELDEALRMGVRADRIGAILLDFHTITGNIHTAQGGSKFGTKLSSRYYRQDAVYLVVLAGPEELLLECKVALENPKWTISLGRKSCVPSRPVFEELTDKYSSLKQLLEEYPPLMENPELADSTMICEIENEYGNLEKQDKILNNPARMYGFRKINRFTVPRKEAET